MFFVISGFCIHYPYREIGLRVQAFLVARYIRVLLPTACAYLIAKWLNIQSYNFVDGWILWSIVCELWYYTLYPIFLMGSKKYSWNVMIAVSFFVSLFIVTYVGHDQWGNIITYGPHLNWLVSLPAWLLGCSLAEYGIANSTTNYRSILCWRAAVAFTASILAYLSYNDIIGYCYTINYFSIMIFFWIRSEISAKESKSIFDRIGSFSFSIYLIHMLAYTAIGTKFGAPLNYYNYCAKIVCCFVACYVFHRIIELPSHILSRKIFLKLKLAP